ncbi:MAG: carbon-nitrogen hydrolase family protein [Zoogloeaceae bacterium]|jgi:nitrilase|nr:carbon-nitrogen hydrolase family protein [Zoogloeaceae bacterium]
MASGADVAENLATASRLLAQAADAGAQLVALPEFFPIMGVDDAARLAVSESFGAGPIQAWLQETALRHRFWLCAGSIPLRSEAPGRIYNSALVFDPAGKCRARYDKMHLFAFNNGREQYDEAASVLPGGRPVALETPFGRVGLSICYDLRFPELYRAMGTPDLLLAPAAFTERTGRAHWEILLRARAIENQCYLLAPAQGGQHADGRRTHGNSLILDPWGEILDRKGKGCGLVIAELDHDRIREVRQRFQK